MPRPGGESDKLGNRYEALWTVYNLIDVLAGDAVALQPEPYEASIGIEFIKTLRDGSEEFHSVKRQRAGSGWTLGELTRLDERGRSVLKDLFDKLGNDSRRAVVFVSTTVHSQAYELWDRSQRCHSPEEFTRQLRTDKALHEDFTRYLLPLCDNDLAIALRRFHALRLVPIGEHELRRQVETRVRGLLYRVENQIVDSSEVALRLADFIYNSLGRRLIEGDVRSELATLGYHLKDWARDAHVSGQVRSLNERYLRHVEADLVLGNQIPRREAADVAQALKEPNGKRAQLVVGAAGLGKSCVLAQIIRGLEKSEINFLALRLDNVSAVSSTRALGRILELPDSPAIVLAGLCKGKRAILLLDQLDAMSVVSGRNSNLWQTFEELLQEASLHPELRLLLACRAFDLEHDPRLAGLAKKDGPAQRIDLMPLPTETVKEVVKQGGASAERLSHHELEILRTPFHLHLFLHGEPNNPVSFGGRQMLFARFWDTKRRKANARNIDFDQAVGLLTDALSKSESISTPASRLDMIAQSADALVSDNVFVMDGGRYRFFHESFFDYAFARRFVREGRDLVRFLTQECVEQHLFRRAQVRQVLAYQRDDDREAYLVTLSTLLNHEAVRFHLKKLVLEWLAGLENPIEEEWHIVERLLKHPQLRWAAFGVLWGRLSWFDLLCQRGILSRVLSDSDTGFVDLCVRAFCQVETLTNRSSQVARLLRPYLYKGTDWSRRFNEIFCFGHFHHSQEMFELVLELIDDGLFDGGDECRWYPLTEMAEQRGDFAVKILARVLERAISQATLQGATNPFDITDRNRQIDPRFISIAAEKNPTGYAEEVVPIIKRLVLANAKPAKYGGYYDDIWNFIRFGPEHETTEALLGSAARALHALAGSDPQKCWAVLNELQALEHKTLRFLLVCGWNGNPTYFAETAAVHLVNYPLALMASYEGGAGKATNVGSALVLLKSISPLVRSELHARLEAAVYGYVTPYEKVERKYRGHFELNLWRQLKPERLTKKGNARMEELQTKFPEKKMTRSQARIQERRRNSCFVPPPIPQIGFEKMSDSQLIKALRLYSSTRRGAGLDSIERDAHGLFSYVQRAAKRNRRRFAELMLKLPDDILPLHFDAIMYGLVDNEMENARGESNGSMDAVVSIDPLLPVEALLEVVERANRLPGKPCGRAICRVADTVANGFVPNDLIEIVAYYAIEDPDPAAELWKGDSASGIKYYGGDPLAAGINSTRGAAADSFGRFLFAHREMAERLLPFLEALANDKAIAVRAVNIQGLMALLNTHRDKAVEIFLETCQSCERLWTCRPVEDFLYYATFSHYSALRPLLKQMLAGEKVARHAAARQVTLAAFCHPEAEEDMEYVLRGDEECRRGMAEIYANNVHNESVREKCVANLEKLFNDPAKVVRDTVAKWFHGRNGLWPDWQRSLLSKYAESSAFGDGHFLCLMNLNDTTARLPEEVIRIGERSLELYARESEKMKPVSFQFSHYLPGLTLRFYEQSKHDAIRRKCLDLLDRMIAFGWGEASMELAKGDRW